MCSTKGRLSAELLEHELLNWVVEHSPNRRECLSCRKFPDSMAMPIRGAMAL